ncbi:MAG: hypothetical protein AB7H43_15625 [Acidimicrobiia bacterium]
MSASRTTFTIRQSATGHRSNQPVPAHVAVDGPLDAAAAAALRMVVGDLVDSRDVVVDLRACAPLQPEGIAVLDRLAEGMRARGGALATIGGVRPCPALRAWERDVDTTAVAALSR